MFVITLCSGVNRYPSTELQAALQAREVGPQTRSRGAAGLTGVLAERDAERRQAEEGKGPRVVLVRTPAQAAKADAAKAEKAAAAKKALDEAEQAAAETSVSEEDVEDVESLSTDEGDDWAVSVDEEAAEEFDRRCAEVHDDDESEEAQDDDEAAGEANDDDGEAVAGEADDEVSDDNGKRKRDDDVDVEPSKRHKDDGEA